MTRQTSIHSVIGRGRGPTSVLSAPKEGTRLRDTYDRFRRGETIQSYKDLCCELVFLRDYYGLEIEHIGRKLGYRLLGEWDGPYFVPIEQIVTDDEPNQT